MKEWIYGRNPVIETLLAKRRQPFRLLMAAGSEEKGKLGELLKLAAQRQLPVERVQRLQLDKLVGGDNHQGVALEVGAYPYMGVADIRALAEKRGEPLFVLALDMIQDPQNLGTLLRTAEIVGVHGVLLPLRRAAEVTPAVVRASAGATEHLLLAQTNLAQALDELQRLPSHSPFTHSKV
jgi:23S rRNA (guanosine2251-2'-O)-methyltransferase